MKIKSAVLLQCCCILLLLTLPRTTAQKRGPKGLLGPKGAVGFNPKRPGAKGSFGPSTVGLVSTVGPVRAIGATGHIGATNPPGTKSPVRTVTTVGAITAVGAAGHIGAPGPRGAAVAGTKSAVSTAGPAGSGVGPKGDIGSKGDAELPYCKIDAITAQRIQEIKAFLRGTPPPTKPPIGRQGEKGHDGPQKRSVRSGAVCSFVFPDCNYLFIRVYNGEATFNADLTDCCTKCQEKNFSECEIGTTNCTECYHEWGECIKECNRAEVCPEGDRGAVGQPGPTMKNPKGDKGEKPTDKPKQRCPTEIVKEGESSCIKRSCFPIVV